LVFAVGVIYCSCTPAHVAKPPVTEPQRSTLYLNTEYILLGLEPGIYRGTVNGKPLLWGWQHKHILRLYQYTGATLPGLPATIVIRRVDAP
jgi:hypothetical protein